MNHITIVVATYRRNDQLRFNLQSLSRQSFRDFDVIIMDDCYIADQQCQELVNKYSGIIDIKYVHSGKTKKGDIWRVPGFAYNIGARMASGGLLAISCAETYHTSDNSLQEFSSLFNDSQTIYACPSHVYDDRTGCILNCLKGNKPYGINKGFTLNRLLPFFIVVDKQSFINIGGYDEDYTGHAYEDTDLMRRFVGFHPGDGLLGYDIKCTSGDIIHLYHGGHGASQRGGQAVNSKKLFDYNKQIFMEKTGSKKILFRNVGKKWGEL